MPMSDGKLAAHLAAGGLFLCLLVSIRTQGWMECSPGYECVCSPGYEWFETVGCVPCQVDHFKPDVGWHSCWACPKDTSTYGLVAAENCLTPEQNTLLFSVM